MHVLDFIVQFYQRRSAVLLVVLLAVTVLAVFIARSLSLEADLSHLLPDDAPSVQGLNELEQRYGGSIGRLTVVLESDDPERTREAAHALAERIEAIDDVARVELTRPTVFFETHRLLYIDFEDLEEVARRVRRYIRTERAQANPLFADLGERSGDELDLSDIEQRYGDIGGGTYYTSNDGRQLVFFVYPDFPAADLAKSELLVTRVETIGAQLLAADYPGVELAMTGRYAKRVEQQEILARDLQVATIVAMALLLSFLIIYLRSLLATVLVLVPLIAGTVWAFAFAALAFGTLNILTGFLGGILLGLGVDYGIHLVGRYYDVRATGGSVGEALSVALVTAGKASVFAGVTTMIALGSLALSSFRAFFEFGIIAMGGITLVLLAYATIFPALVLTAARLTRRSKRLTRMPLSVVLSMRLAPSFTLTRDAPPQARRAMRVRFGVVAALLGTLVVLAIVGLPRLELARDFRVVQMTDTPTWALDEQVNAILGRSQTPAVVLVESPEHRRAVTRELLRRKAEEPGGYTIDQVRSVDDLLPTDQAARVELLTSLEEDIRSALAERGDASGEDDARAREFLDEIVRVREAAPIERSDLPDELLIPFSRQDRADASVVLVFYSVPLEQAYHIENFASVMRDLPRDPSRAGERLDAINDALMLAEILEFVQRDTLWMITVTVAGLLVAGLLAFGLTRPLAWLVGAVSLALFCVMGLIGFVGLELNFLNIVIVPMWLGLCVDAPFHMYLRLREEPERVQPHLSVAGSVTAAFLTSMFGFGSLLVAHHTGLISLGSVAVVGLGTILVVNLLIQLLIILRNQLAKAPAAPRAQPRFEGTPMTTHET